MNTLMIFVILFGVLLAPAQTIGDMKMLKGGVMASQDGEHIYLLAPAGTEIRVGETSVLVDHGRLQIAGHDDPWWVSASDNGMFKIPSERLGVAGASEITVAVRQPSGEFIDQKVENVAGKVILLPGDTTLIRGQLLHISTVVDGAPSEVRLTAGLKVLKLGTNTRKTRLSSGAVATEYLEGFELLPGYWKVTFLGRNKKGSFSATIGVRVLETTSTVECSVLDCWNDLK